MKEVLDYAQEHADEILRTLRDMVEPESFSSGKGGQKPNWPLWPAFPCWTAGVEWERPCRPRAHLGSGFAPEDGVAGFPVGWGVDSRSDVGLQ